MHEIAPLVTSTAVIFIGILVGVIFNQRAVEKLESRIDHRFDEVGKRFDRMDARFDRVDARIDRMQLDLTGFYRIQSRHEEAIETLKKRTNP